MWCERYSSLNAVQKALKAGQRAEAGGPGGPTANVQAETEAPKRMLSSELPGGRSSHEGVKRCEDEEVLLRK